MRLLSPWLGCCPRRSAPGSLLPILSGCVGANPKEKAPSGINRLECDSERLLEANIGFAHIGVGDLHEKSFLSMRTKQDVA